MPAVLWAAGRPRAVYGPAAGVVAPAVSAGPAAADAPLAEPVAALTARGLVAAEPAAVAPPGAVVAPAISALAVVANDARAPAASEFASARAEIEPAAAQPRVVAAVTESSVVWQLPSEPAVVDASFVVGPAQEPVGPPVGLLPGPLRLELFARLIAVCATPASAGARFDRRAQPVSPDQPFAVPAPALPQGLAVGPFARRRADLRSEAFASSLDHSMPLLVKSAPDHA